MNQVDSQVRRVALVTGAARRIGAAIATFLHQKGYRVAIHYHASSKEALALVSDLNEIRAGSAQGFKANLALKEEAIAVVHEVASWAGQLDLLVNNAALFARIEPDPLEDALWDALFTLNVRAPFWLSHTAYPLLKRQRGSIVNITDRHAASPLKQYAVYCQSKAALSMQTKALAGEFAPDVRVNAVAPGAIAWPEHKNALSPAQQARIIEKTLLKQHGDPIFIAEAVWAFVNNPFITGQTLCVDGGRGA